MLYIYSGRASNGAVALGQQPGFRKLLIRTTVRGAGRTIINWGNSLLPIELTRGATILNSASMVAVASNKLHFFSSQAESRVTVLHTTDKGIALVWLSAGHKVVCRTVLNGSGGRGIVIARSAQELVDAPLYTRYFKKDQEYRVHFMADGGQPEGTPAYAVIDVQRKARATAVPDEQVNWEIRNHANGFIYAREGFECPAQVKEVALIAAERSGLHFGAVDIVYHSNNNIAKVLEINTAPGLEGTTVMRYAENFRRIYGQDESH